MNVYPFFFSLLVTFGVNGLDLSHSYLSSQFPRLEEVKQIKLTDKTLGRIEANAFAHMYLLKELDMSSLEISSINVDSFNHLVSLELLNLQLNQLVSLSPRLFNGFRLLSLKSLDLSFNRISNISKVFVELNSLESLSLFGNRLRSIEEDAFDQISGIKRLDLGSNQLSNLTPTTFKGLSHLRVLSLSLNNLQVLDQHAFTPIASTLAHLDLSYNFLRSIPKQALSTLAQLQTLNLANNHIIDIGEDSIAPASPILSTLHTLNLESNELTTVQLPAFQNLTFISFNNNRLSFLSHAMFSALDEATIEELRFEYNEISFIDTDTFSGFAALKSLDISGNRLARIKPDIFKTVCLESLYLARNPVSLYMISQRREVNCIRLDACNSDRHLVPIKGKTFVYKRNEK